jgi:cytoskeletal protein RodZ
MTNDITAELRRAREAAGLSLADVADATLINVRFLGEIDEGRFDFLPQSYVRAFLREYAATVGLAPDDLLRRYDAAAAPQTAPSPSPVAAVLTPPQVQTHPPVPERAASLQVSPRVAPIALTAVGVLALVVILWNALTPDQKTQPGEIPFDDVRAEHERAARTDTMTAGAAVAAAAPRTDSLTLTAAALDSVWLQIRIDEGPVRTLILRKGSKTTWKAATRFTLTLGNAGGAEFTLNSRALGRLGAPGTVLRALELSHATLKGPAVPSRAPR